MMTIRTLDEMLEYFRWLKTQPLPTGPHEFAVNRMPILEAFSGWGDIDVADLFMQLGLALAVERGQDGRETLSAATEVLAETVLKHEMLKGMAN